jgi:SWI/SNF-related matrix-associated actin-dependent regulator 1 of chromatin subfamily A
MQAGGAGIDLSRASTAIYFSVGFSLGDYKQSQSRLHRPGQRNNVTYVHLVASNTVDEKVYTALKRRENIVESILSERNN